VQPRPSASLPWVVFVVVAAAIASPVDVSHAFEKSDDADQIAPAAVAVAEVEAVSGSGVPGSRTASEASFPRGPETGSAREMDGPMDGSVLAATVGVADEELLQEPVELAFARLPSGRDRRQVLSLQIRKDDQKEEIMEEYDPWHPFNEGTFAFNRHFDRFLMKPVATVWDKILPDFVQQILQNTLDNIGMPRRLVNNLLQLKLKGAGQELARFLLNSTFGFGGFVDIAKTVGLEKSDEDTGQTLGAYGAGPGPYLVLPLLPPLTVRDGIGLAVDGLLDPLNYVLPFAALAARTGAGTINERSLNLEFYENVEESVLDLYTAVRNAYLQRRAKAISE